MKRIRKVLFPFLLAASLLVVGCGDDGGSSGPPPRPTRDGGTDGSVATDGGGQDGNVDGDGAGSCVGPNGCFNCEPTSSLELLNRCTSAQCEPYDNRANLTLLRSDGTAPPLP